MSNPIPVIFLIFPANDLDLDAIARQVEKNIYTSTTYEDIIHLLQLNSFLADSKPFMVFTKSLDSITSHGVQLKKGETFEQIYIILKSQPGTTIYCFIEPSIYKYAAEILYPDINSLSSTPPKKKPSSPPFDWGDLVSNVFDKIAGGASIIALLDAVERRWRERSTTNDAHPHQVASGPSETDIMAIRLRMTHGPDHEFEEWLTEPAKLKHYIDVFNQQGTTILPLRVVFVQRNGTELPVDVLKGTQNNPQLDELLSYLHTDETDKDVAKRKAKSWRIHFIFSHSVTGKPDPSKRELWATIYDLNITYEELIEFLIQKKHFLLPLDPPSRYTLTLKGIVNDELSLGPTILKEGQTVLNNVHKVHFIDSSNYTNFHYECDISIYLETSPVME